ncbi:MAG: alpha/beta hydrolase [Cyclobacteriaceae bacterium]
MNPVLIISDSPDIRAEHFASGKVFDFFPYTGDFNSEGIIDFPEDLQTACYGEVRIIDLYLEKIYKVLASLLRYMSENECLPERLIVFTYANIDRDLLDEYMGHTELVLLEPPVYVNSDGELVVSDQQPYIEHFIRLLAKKIATYRDEIELRYSGYFDLRKIYIPKKDYGTLKAVDIDIAVYDPQTHWNNYASIQAVITYIGSIHGLEIEANDALSEGAISMLFFTEILSVFASVGDEVDQLLPATLLELIDTISLENSSEKIKGAQPVLELFDEKSIVNSQGEFRYFTTEKRNESIVIINALGISIYLWENMIRALQPYYQVIVWETRCGSIVDGGMEAIITIDEHAQDIISLLETEKPKKSNILAWCNGARIGITVASKLDSLNKLILLSPSFKGITGDPADDTTFEKQMDGLFMQVRANPKNADPVALFFKKAIERKLSLENLSEEELLGLNNESLKPMVFYHLCHGKYLINHEKRAKNDHNYNLDEYLENLDKKVLFILGENDSVVSNELIRQVAQRFKNKKILTIAGGSHYTHVQGTGLVKDLILRFLTGYEDYQFTSTRIKAEQKATFVI